MPEKYDEPKCCKDAGLLITWLPKGLPIPKPGERLPLMHGNRQYGPAKEGWAITLEGAPTVHINAKCCPFCGANLSEPDSNERA